MNAKELMIGNFVLNRDGEVMRIGRIGRKKVHQAYFVIDGVRWTSEEIDYIKPIPLSEEWLFRFGFEYSGGMGYKSPHNTSYWHFSLANGFVPSIYAKHTVSSDGYVGCKYVHQLQNLFYFLSGEELTLKSETE